jgi:O-antigen/teichoic acid export membrane protein
MGEQESKMVYVEGKSIKRKIVRNTLSNIFLSFGLMGISLIMLPIIVKHIGVVDYGIFMIVGEIVGYTGLLQFGVGTALVKYIAQYNAKGDKEKINELVNSTFVFFLFIGLIAASIVAILGTFFTDIFIIESDYLWKARGVAYLTMIGLISWPMTSISSTIAGLQRYDVSAKIKFSASIVVNIGIYILLINGYGILELLLWGVITGGIINIIRTYISTRYLPFLQLKMKYMGLKPLKRIFKFSSVLFFNQITTLIIRHTDKIVLGIFVGVGSVTFYSVAEKLHNICNRFCQFTGSAILPSATELDTLKRKEAINRLIIRGGKYRNAMTFSVTTVIFIMAEPIIRFWMGAEFLVYGGQSMVVVTQVFVSYLFIFSNWGITGQVLLAKEKFGPILLLKSLLVIINLTISLILVQYIGMLGVVIGTAFPFIVLMFLWIPYGFRLVGLNIREYAKEVIFPTTSFAFIVGVVLYDILFFYTPTSLITVGVICLFGVGLYALLFYTFSMPSNEKEEMWRYIRKILLPKKATNI